MIEFRAECDLPWPPRSLSPNARQHWAAHARAKKKYRNACFLSVLEARLPGVPDGPLLVTLEFLRPDRRRYDQDGLLARMKAGLDGVAEALGVDDHRFDLQKPLFPDQVVAGGCVHVVIEARADE